eukprot:jgi/Orpsp1_1/1176525/evm.model.c7180000057939.1
MNQTITCTIEDGCQTTKVDLGYYVNAGDLENNPIIRCEKENTECISEKPKCPLNNESAVGGNYCYSNNQLIFYPSNNSTAISASNSNAYYIHATITLVISQVFLPLLVLYLKGGNLVESLNIIGQDANIYDCNSSTKLCTLRPGCIPNTYMLDSEHKKAIFCNNGILEYAEFTGYVVDGNYVRGSSHPYLIKCENKGTKCNNVKPKNTSYYINSGFDSETNTLIYCSNNNCVSTLADNGYYIGENGEGIIHCISPSSCSFSQAKSNERYVNADSNKVSYPLIHCTKNDGCIQDNGKIGYYMSHLSTILIHCTSSSNCNEYLPTPNYYENADSSENDNSIINCVENGPIVTCSLESTNTGFYMSNLFNDQNVNLLPLKMVFSVEHLKEQNLILNYFNNAISIENNISNNIYEFKNNLILANSTNNKILESSNNEDNSKITTTHLFRDNEESYGIIRCIAGKCTELSPEEVASIPMCEFNNNKCYITLDYAMMKSATTSITAGNICTNPDRSIFYFATDTIVVKPNVIDGKISTYVYTTTNSNCVEVNDSYSNMYFTVDSSIYILDKGSVLQFTDKGYFFINTSTNTLVSGNDINQYNNENILLYSCNGIYCKIVEKPDTITYYTDINKRIIKYNPNNDVYSFAYPKDITCIFSNNKCTPNADIKEREFCVTYKGELVLVKSDIKNRETGDCFKASSISFSIYGLSEYLYEMNVYSAQMVHNTGYHIINLSTNSTISINDFKSKYSKIIIYGCENSSYGRWISPTTSGYALISINPSNTYIYRFTKTNNEIVISNNTKNGYYYTINNEMYYCDSNNEYGECLKIEDTGYYFTNSGEVYYCIHDSEELEETECTKQICINHQLYYINNAYYRCESGSTLVPVMSKNCIHDNDVIINFPIALIEEYPFEIKEAADNIQKKNNSTAIINLRNKNYLTSISGIFTNCTYNAEETTSTFDLVCINNYVILDKNTNKVIICSIEQFGYVECLEDNNNPEKCNISRATNSILLKLLIEYYNTHNIILELNKKNKDGDYPLLQAISLNNFEIVRLLLNYGNSHNITVELNEKNKDGEYPILLAIFNNNIEIVKSLINYSDENNIFLELNVKDGYGNYPISYAISNNNIEMVKLLMEYSNSQNITLELNEKNETNGEYPLYLAIKHENIEIIKSIVKYSIIHNIILDYREIDTSKLNSEIVELLKNYEKGEVKILKK